jgi:cell division initiation protein
MKMTPLEIRQKSFNKKLFGGVDPEEVSAFLSSLSSSWERLLEENRELKFRLETAERDANQFREVQSALYKAIKTAEDKHAELVESGTQQAQFMIREAKATSENTLKDAEWRSRTMVEEAEQVAKNTYKELKSEVNSLRNEYNQLEGMRQLLLTEIKNFSNELLERVDRAAIKHVPANFDVPPTPNYLLGPEKKQEEPIQPTEYKQATPGRPFTRVNQQAGRKGNTPTSGPNANLANEIIASYSSQQPSAKAEEQGPIYTHNALSSISETIAIEEEEGSAFELSGSESAVVVQLSTEKQIEQQQVDQQNSLFKGATDTTPKQTVKSGSFFDNA